MSDIEIAYAAKKKPIIELCEERFGIPKERLEPYGHHKAKYTIDEAVSYTHLTLPTTPYV